MLTAGAIDDRLRSLQPVTAANFEALSEAAWSSTDPVRLELCRLRLAELLEDPSARLDRTRVAVAAGLDEQKVAALSAWMTSPLFDAADRAHLAFAEQFSLAVASMGEDQVAALLVHLSAEELSDFVIALYVVEVQLRLRLVARRLLSEQEEPR